jgi:glycosyltransferase involved in cell wall biosynthesis
MPAKLSVIIPVYNAEATLAAQLEALAMQQWSEPWEVLVVNNRSTDNSMDIAEQYCDRLPGFRIADACAQQGQPYALNVGLEAAAGESVVFCDADDEVAPGWLPAIGQALETHRAVACRFDTQKLNPTWLWKSRANPQYNGLHAYRYPPYLPHAGGGGLGVRRGVCQALGGFDTSLPLLHDTDFCWRLQLSGIPIQFVPEAVVYIRLRRDLRSTYCQARAYAEYNVLLYKRYRSRGMPSLHWWQGMRGWWRLARKTTFLRSRKDLAEWVWQFGWQVGRLEGSLKHKVMAL